MRLQGLGKLYRAVLVAAHKLEEGMVWYRRCLVTDSGTSRTPRSQYGTEAVTRGTQIIRG